MVYPSNPNLPDVAPSATLINVDGAGTTHEMLHDRVKAYLDALASDLVATIAQNGGYATQSAMVAALWSAIGGKVSASALTAHENDTTNIHGIVDTAQLATLTALATKADLVGGKVPTSQIPAIAMRTYLGSVGSQAAMLALVGEPGDFATRTDSPNIGTWEIIGTPTSSIGSWLYIPSAPQTVTSVNSQVGAVNLNAANVGAEPAGAINTHKTAADDHAAGVVSFSPAGLAIVTGTNVQAAIAQLDAAAALAGKMIEVQDEGSSLSTNAKKFNFIGAGITVTEPVPDEFDVTVSGGGGGFAWLDLTTWPTAGQGNNGDYAWVRSNAEAVNAAYIVGPKVAGAWPQTGYAISKGANAKQVLAGSPFTQGAIVNNPTNFAACDGYSALPDSGANGFENVSGLAWDVNGVYGATTGIVQSRGAHMSKASGGVVNQPIATLAMSKVRMAVLPGTSSGYAGCGSGGSAAYWFVTTNLGKPMLVAVLYGGAPQWATPMAAGVNGDVVPNDILVYKREGVLFTCFVVDGTTGAIKRTLNAVVGGAGDAGGSQYFANGASTFRVFNDTTARMLDGWVMA